MHFINYFQKYLLGVRIKTILVVKKEIFQQHLRFAGINQSP